MWDSYLAAQVEQYYGECRPQYDGDGDPINCLDCDNKECEYWKEVHNDK